MKDNLIRKEIIQKVWSDEDIFSAIKLRHNIRKIKVEMSTKDRNDISENGFVGENVKRHIHVRKIARFDRNDAKEGKVD